MKKNNKGFSLVELIVVILIIAVLGVALAPAVLRWVENARRSNDLNTMATVMTAAEAALATEKAYEKASAVSFNIYVQKGGVTYDSTAPTEFTTAFEKNLPGGSASGVETSASGGKITIWVNKGKVVAAGTGSTKYECSQGDSVASFTAADLN